MTAQVGGNVDVCLLPSKKSLLLTWLTGNVAKLVLGFFQCVCVGGKTKVYDKTCFLYSHSHYNVFLCFFSFTEVRMVVSITVYLFMFFQPW